MIDLSALKQARRDLANKGSFARPAKEKQLVCTENLIRVDEVMESSKLAEWLGCSISS
jgi:hypothetical protein